MENSFEKVSYFRLVKMFPDGNSARKFIEHIRWNGNVVCPLCGSEHVTGRKGKREGYYCATSVTKSFP